MHIKISGSVCKKGVIPNDIAMAAFKPSGIGPQTGKVTYTAAVASYGLRSTPDLRIDENPLFAGHVLSQDKIYEALTSQTTR